jgi:hypothetical protein
MHETTFRCSPNHASLPTARDPGATLQLYDGGGHNLSQFQDRRGSILKYVYHVNRHNVNFMLSAHRNFASLSSHRFGERNDSGRKSCWVTEPLKKMQRVRVRRSRPRFS